MSRMPPQIQRKSSVPWDRLRSVKQDPLDSVGFVSKGDTRLLDTRTQESYYQKITARYMQFCTQNSKNLNDAFASLSLDGTHSASADPTTNPPVQSANANFARPASAASSVCQSSNSRPETPKQIGPDPADELSNILTALRKLREGLLATTRTPSSIMFSQRVHVFNIRIAILAFHPPSYHASLHYLLTVLHTKEHPLSTSELREMTVYHILDTALREGDWIKAYSLRLRARSDFDFMDTNVDGALRAAVTNNWPLFWKVRGKVDGYVRSIMYWHIDTLRKTTLKAIGKSYMRCDVDWILRGAVGRELTWEDLVEKETIGWLRDGDMVLIRKPKMKA